MKVKKIARYFYAPICPESFAALSRLKILFEEIEDCHFEAYDLLQDVLESPFPWFPNEKNLLRTCTGQYDKPYLYGILFIEGEEVKGFPPSPKYLKEVLIRHNLPWPEDKYQFPYSSQYINQRKKFNQMYEENKFIFKFYTESDLESVCQLCTLHHPYLDPDQYSYEYWSSFEDKKKSYLAKVLKSEELYGMIVYYKKESAGFIEAYPIKLAAKMGYPVTDICSQGVMITCLSIRSEFSGNRLSMKLIQALEREIKKIGIESIEVLAFPDDHNWQPKSMYEKNGYLIYKKIDNLFLLKKKLVNNC